MPGEQVLGVLDLGGGLGQDAGVDLRSTGGAVNAGQRGRATGGRGTRVLRAQARQRAAHLQGQACQACRLGCWARRGACGTRRQASTQLAEDTMRQASNRPTGVSRTGISWSVGQQRGQGKGRGGGHERRQHEQGRGRAKSARRARGMEATCAAGAAGAEGASCSASGPVCKGSGCGGSRGGEGGGGCRGSTRGGAEGGCRGRLTIVVHHHTLSHGAAGKERQQSWESKRILHQEMAKHRALKPAAGRQAQHPLPRLFPACS